MLFTPWIQGFESKKEWRSSRTSSPSAFSEKSTESYNPGISGLVCIWMDQPAGMIPGLSHTSTSFGKIKSMTSTCFESVGCGIPDAGFPAWPASCQTKTDPMLFGTSPGHIHLSPFVTANRNVGFTASKRNVSSCSVPREMFTSSTWTGRVRFFRPA